MAGQSALPAFPDCHRCGSFRDGPAPVCFACASRRLTRPGPDACPVCAQRTGPDGRCPNQLCRDPRRRISRIHAIGYQAGPLRQAINSYKFRGDLALAAVLGRLLLAWLETALTGATPGLIVANPSFVGPGGQRFGHTEAVIAAAAAADSTGRWPFDTAVPAAIVKTAPTLRSADAQAWSKRVSGLELREALRVTDRARTAGQTILVYDDVCTTGTQLDAVAGCLLDFGGAARVEGVVLARAAWRSQPK
jgi:predicted amidophosphoribosyltransferase